LGSGLRGGSGVDRLGLGNAGTLAPLDAVKMARKKMWVRHDKAGRELDYSAKPADWRWHARRLVSGQRIL